MEKSIILSSQGHYSFCKKHLLRLVRKIIFFGVLLYFVPYSTLFYILCGVLDIRRNSPLTIVAIDRYFGGKGILTWLLSPINLFFDLLCFKNLGIYQLEDLPKEHQQEVKAVIEFAINNKENIQEYITTTLNHEGRSMLMLNWMGYKTPHPNLHLNNTPKNLLYVKTIGFSFFTKKTSTSWHYGPIRPTLRVLYNLQEEPTDEVYIDVGGHRHFWREKSLFIFDDTLFHQSVNGSNKNRCCLFVDILRPTKFKKTISCSLFILQYLLRHLNQVFYKQWKFIH